MNSPALLSDPSPAVDASAPVAPHNAWHRRCVAHAREAALWAALTGLELMAHRLHLPHGAWMDWVKANCEFSHRTATCYLGAAERIIEVLGEIGLTPSEVNADTLEQIKLQIRDVLEGDHLDERRAAMIAALCPAPPPQLPAPTSPRPRAPRPPIGPRGWTFDVVPKVIERFRVSPPEVRHAFYEAIREEAIAYLVP